MNAITTWAERNPSVAQRGIDESTWSALCSTVYPGARPDSILLAIDYCRARGLDVMLKPIHLVSLEIKDAETGVKRYRDVPMPGIGLYRIQADRSGNYAGADEPEFGPPQVLEQPNAYNPAQTIRVTYPEWCKYTVYKFVHGERVAYTSREYWLENYAVQKSGSEAPNSMWKKRPYAQLAKCAEAQALRKAWPEIGSEPTAEEMEGKAFAHEEKDITPTVQQEALPEYYPEADFQKNFPVWKGAIEAGKQTPERVISMVSSKGKLTNQQIEQIRGVAA